MMHIKRIDEMANVNTGGIKNSLENFMLFEMKWRKNGVKKTQYGLFIKKGTLYTPERFGDSLAVTQCNFFIGSWFDVDELDDNLHYMYSDETTDMYVSRIWYPIESLKEKNKEFDPLNTEVSKLSTKIEALQQITTSKLATYRPLIILELIQKLKPEQIWFKSILIDKIKLEPNKNKNTTNGPI